MPAADPSAPRDLRRGGPGRPSAATDGGPLRRGRAWWRAATFAQRRFAVLATVLLVVATGAVVGWGLAGTVGQASWRDLTYEVQGDRTVVVRYEVTKPPQQSARCVVVAKEVNHGTVGRVEDVVGPSENPTVARKVSVRTTSLAVIGMVDSCQEF